MTQAKYLSTAFLGALLIAGCTGGGGGPGGDQGGSGDNYSGDGSGSGSGSDNNAGGADQDDAGAAQPTYPTQHPRIYIEANRARLKASLASNTRAATRFRTTVDNWVNGTDVWGFQVWNAALLGQLTGDPKYCTKAIATVDASVAADEALIAAGSQPNVAHDSYLHVGDVLGDLALTYDWCFDSITAAQKSRWIAYANTTLYNLWHPTTAKWGSRAIPWSGWATNDPANNYFYSFMRATMLVGLATKGEDPSGDTWINLFHDTKMLGQLVPTFDSQLRGGGSREGTAYGVSMRGLFNLYDMWYATTGEKLQAKTKHARQSLRTAVHQIVPTLDHIAPTGDQPRDHSAAFFDYQRQYLTELIQLYPHDPFSPKVKTLLTQTNVPEMARQELLVWDFLYDDAEVTGAPFETIGTSYYASGIGQVYSRSGWDKQATWLDFTAGPYTQSHAHQDQGSFLIYKGGWLGYDGEIDSASGIIQETGGQSLVRIASGGTTIKQSVNTTSTMAAVHKGAGWFYAAGDVTAAYAGNANISKVQREMLFIEPNTIVVYDRVATSASTTQTWQLVTPVAPTVAGPTARISGAHTMDVARLVPATGATSVATSLSSTNSDYRGGYRLDTMQPGGDRRYLHVLSIDGAVASAVATGDNAASIHLANGQTATVTFNHDDIGATLDFNGTTTQLGAGIDMLPE